MGRTAYGVRGISLREGDAVMAMEVLRPAGTILSVTEKGYGKRTALDEYRVQSRGGVGIINIQTSDRNGKVVGIAQVTDAEELMLITQQGKILRMASKAIRTIGRSTQGVRLIDIEGDDRAVSIARLAEQDEAEDLTAVPLDAGLVPDAGGVDSVTSDGVPADGDEGDAGSGDPPADDE